MSFMELIVGNAFTHILYDYLSFILSIFITKNIAYTYFFL